jgi:hypothetical protein
MRTWGVSIFAAIVALASVLALPGVSQAATTIQVLREKVPVTSKTPAWLILEIRSNENYYGEGFFCTLESAGRFQNNETSKVTFEAKHPARGKCSWFSSGYEIEPRGKSKISSSEPLSWSFGSEGTVLVAPGLEFATGQQTQMKEKKRICRYRFPTSTLLEEREFFEGTYSPEGYATTAEDQGNCLRETWNVEYNARVVSQHQEGKAFEIQEMS